MQVAQYLGLLEASEQKLADSFLLVANRHDREPEIRDMCKQLANWSGAHLKALAPLFERYGKEPMEEPGRVHAALFHGTRNGGLGLLRDLQDLLLLATQVRWSWVAVSHADALLHDKELEGICSGCLSETERQLAWLQTHFELAAPQALAISPDPIRP